MKRPYIFIFIAVLILILFGTIMVLSASSTLSATRYDTPFYFFNSQFVKALLGIGLLFGFSLIPYTEYKRYSKPLLSGIVVVLVLMLIFAASVNNARRWVSLGLFSVQPSEIARLLLFIHLAVLIEAKGDKLADFRNGLSYILIWIFGVAGLVLLQPNVSNAVIILIIGFCVLLASGARLRHLVATFGAGAILAGTAGMLFTHSRTRIITYLHSLLYGGDINMQVRQAIIGLGSGGPFGRGFGHSQQRNLFLPEAHNDFIFAVLGEEIGFAGALTVLLMYLFIFFMGIEIVKACKDMYSRVLALSLTLTVVLYAFINAAVATGVFPTTGIPLPFISHGGTSLWIICISMGILISIGRANNKRALPAPEAAHA